MSVTPLHLEALFKEYPQTPAEKEVRDWLKLNGPHFIADGYTPDEVAYLAVKFAELDITAVCSVMSHFQDALTGARFERRAALSAYHLGCALAEVSRMKAELERVPELDLRSHWESLAEYQTGELREAV